MPESDQITIEVVEFARNPFIANMLGLLCNLSFTFLLLAKVTLLWKISTKRDCTGISGKTQILYTLVFAARYLDLASSYYASPLSDTIPKVCLLILSYSIVLSIYFFHYRSYQSQHDKFRLELLILPSLVLGLLANYGVEISDVFWATSVYLEAMAIIPQLYFCSKAKKIESTVYNYILLLTLYKSFHVINEMYNHFYMSTHFDRISLSAGVIQLMLYCDFFTREDNDDNRADLESGNEQPEVFVHPKEAEARRCAMESAAAIAQLNEENRLCGLKEVVLAPSTLPKREEEQASAMPTATEQEEKKTVNLSTNDLTVPKTV